MNNFKDNRQNGKIAGIVAIVMLLAVLCACVFLRLNADGKKTAAPEEIAETEPTPEPETRKYAIACPSSENEEVNNSISQLIEDTKTSFNESFDKASGAVLNISGNGYTSESYFSLEYRVRMSDGSDVTATHIYSLETGEELAPSEIFGENYNEYLSDYFTVNLPEFTENHEIVFSDAVPIVTYSDMTAHMEELGYVAGSYHNFSGDTFERLLIDKNGNVILLFEEGSLYESSEIIRVTVPVKAVNGEYYSTRRLYLDKPMVTLTFDDGPSEVYTPQLLDILAEYNSVATLFELGVHVDEYPEITRRAYEQGCEIGSHTYHHINLAESSIATLQEDKELADTAFMNAIGTVPTLLRPPEGAMGGDGKYFFDVPYIGWSVDTLDWYTLNAASSVKTIQTWRNADWELDLSGQIILFHDIYQTSIDAVREIVPWLINEGYQLVTVSELFEYWYGFEPEPCLYYSGDFFTYHKDPQ